MARPSLLLLDEPASGLSASDVNELIDLLRSLRTRMAIALVEHHVDMVMAVSDTITVLNLGQVIASGTPDEIRANSDVANAYLGQTGRACLRSAISPSRTAASSRSTRCRCRFREGSITAVLGANGAGKTTLVRTISGPRQAAQRLGDARRLSSWSAGRPEAIARLGVGHVPEGHGIISELTVDENLRLGGLWRRDRADQRVAIEEAYELFPPLSSAPRRARVEPQWGRAADALDRPGDGRPPDGAAPRRAVARARRRSARADHAAARGRWSASDSLSVLLIEQNARSALSVADQAVVLSLGRVELRDTRRAPGRRRRAAPRVPGLLSVRPLRDLHRRRDHQRHGLRGGGAGARDDLARDADHQLRAGRDGDVHHLHRARS